MKIITQTAPESVYPAKWKSKPDEPYFIRHFDSSLERDLETFEVMGLHPAMADLPETDAEDETAFTDEEIMDQAQNHGNIRAYNSLFAVTDDDNHVIGWVWYYHDAESPFPDSVARNIGLAEEVIHLEVSYQKLMESEWPAEILNNLETLDISFLEQKRKGVTVSGLRQTLPFLRKTEDEYASKQGEKPKEILIYAYVSLGNTASEKVLQKNNFQGYPEIYPNDGDPCRLWYKLI